MEFDKSRVYTALNADDLKVGSKVIAADTIADIKERVSLEVNITILTQVLDESSAYRFKVGTGSQFEFAYLVSEPEEKKLKWTDLKVGDIIRYTHEHKMTSMVTGIDFVSSLHVYAGGAWLTDSELEDWEKVED